MSTAVDVVAAVFRVGPGEERPGDKTPGEIAELVLAALSDSGWALVPPRCVESVVWDYCLWHCRNDQDHEGLCRNDQGSTWNPEDWK